MSGPEVCLARLVRIGGDDEDPSIPADISLKSALSVFGRAPDAGDADAYLLSPPFVSMNHFIIQLNTSDNIIIFDKSTNGTFLNGMLIGKNKDATAHFGDLISFRFRGKEKIIYKLEAAPKKADIGVADINVVGQGAAMSSSSSKPNVEQLESSKPIGIVAGQLNHVRQENAALEGKLKAASAELETLREELSMANKDKRTNLHLVSTKDAEISDLERRCSDMESHNAAAMARCRNLEETLTIERAKSDKYRMELQQLEDASADFKSLTQSHSNMKEELSRKVQQCEMREDMIDQLNVSLNAELMEKTNILSAKDEMELKYVALSSEHSAQHVKISEAMVTIRQQNTDIEKWKANVDSLVQLVDAAKQEDSAREAEILAIQCELLSDTESFKTLIESKLSKLGKLDLRFPVKSLLHDAARFAVLSQTVGESLDMTALPMDMLVVRANTMDDSSAGIPSTQLGASPNRVIVEMQKPNRDSSSNHTPLDSVLVSQLSQSERTKRGRSSSSSPVRSPVRSPLRQMATQASPNRSMMSPCYLPTASMNEEGEREEGCSMSLSPVTNNAENGDESAKQTCKRLKLSETVSLQPPTTASPVGELSAPVESWDNNDNNNTNDYDVDDDEVDVNGML